jgi:hypothetical protein
MARGRPAGFKMPDEHRTKIANSKILNRLIDFAEGKEGVEMSPHQVTTGLGLLKKVLPDLTYNQHGGDKENPVTFEALNLAPLKRAADD